MSKFRPAGLALAALALLLSFATRVVASQVYLKGHFDLDQVRDAYVMLGIHSGTWPTLGPVSLIGGYSLPPLYYFLSAPAVLLGLHPSLLALPNAILAFLATPLFMALVWRLFHPVERPKRFLLVGLGGLWWSSLYAELLISQVQWNPTPIPAFFFALALTFDSISRDHQSPIWKWLLFGFLAAILINLHSSALIVIPPLFLCGLISLSSWRQPLTKRWIWYPLSSLAAAVVTMLPYWRGEIASGWQNTALMFQTFGSANQGIGPGERLTRIGKAIAFTAQDVALPGLHGPTWLIAAIFGAVWLFILWRLKNQPPVWRFIVSGFGLFLLASSGLYGPFYPHYVILLWPAFGLMALALLALPNRLHLIAWLSHSIAVVLLMSSIWLNWRVDIKYLASKTVLPTINDGIWALKQMPAGATVCDSERNLAPLRYLDAAITRRQLTFTSSPCPLGGYTIRDNYTLLETNGVRGPLAIVPGLAPDPWYQLVDSTNRTRLFKHISLNN